MLVMSDNESHYEPEPGVEPVRIRPYPKHRSPAPRIPRESEVILTPAAAENRTGPSYDQVLLDHSRTDQKSAG